MLSKCANPECFEQFRYLHQGKIFQLSPTPEVQAVMCDSSGPLYERFWLCDRCSKRMTVKWDGIQARIVPLPQGRGGGSQPAPEESTEFDRPRKRAASVSR